MEEQVKIAEPLNEEPKEHEHFCHKCGEKHLCMRTECQKATSRTCPKCKTNPDNRVMAIERRIKSQAERKRD